MFPVELQLPTDKKILFKGAEQLKQWCAKERANWLPLKNVGLPFHGNIYGEIEAPISQIESAVSYFESSGEQPHALQQLRDAIGNLSSMLVSSRYVYSDSLLGRHIRTVSSKNPELCASAYFLAIQQSSTNLNFNRLTSTAASFLAMHHFGISASVAQTSIDTVEASVASISQESSKLETLRLNLEDKIAAVEKQTSQRLSRVFGLVEAQIVSKRARYKRNRDETISDLLRFVREQVRTSRAEIDNFEAFTKDKIALQGPIHYWQSKMRKHRLAAVVSSIALMIYAGSLFCFAKSYLSETYGGLAGFVEAWKAASLSAVGILGVVLALFLMVARVIYRIFVSQLHLWNDSAERVTMTETYLSLAERGHAREELLGALFARLFSPASDGIVRDDLGAVSPFDAMTKVLNSKQ